MRTKTRLKVGLFVPPTDYTPVRKQMINVPFGATLTYRDAQPAPTKGKNDIAHLPPEWCKFC